VPPPSPTVMNVRSASPIWFRSSCSAISAHRSPISGRPPAPMPRVTPPPIRSLRSAFIESRCTASVFTTTVRAPWMPMRWRRWTEFPPAPPQPTTTTFGRPTANESRNDWFPVRCAVSRPIPGRHPKRLAVGTALLARPRVARPCHGPISRPLPWPCGADVGRTRGPRFGPRPRRTRSRPTSRAAAGPPRCPSAVRS